MTAICFKTPKIPPVRAAPVANVNTEAATRDEARRLRGQRGVLDNIFTSALGDTGFGRNVQKLAKLGGASA